MKGIVFTELLAMAESVAGEDAVDEILDDLDLESGGAYTAVGNYPCRELFEIVEALSKRLEQPADDLQIAFGRWMHGRFIELYPGFFEGKRCAFDMLEAIENEVHVEVRKLYPDAELPKFDTRRDSDDRLEMIYTSERPLGGFCNGLIEACLAHFGERADVSSQIIPRPGQTRMVFTIERHGA